MKKHKHNSKNKNKPPHKGTDKGHTKVVKKPQQKHAHTHKTVALSGPRPSLFGTHAVTEAWLNKARACETLYVTAQSLNGFQDTLHKAEQTGLKRPAPTIIDKEQMDKILPQGAVHQGLALACNNLPEHSLKDLLILSKDEPNSLFLILDQVTDPHNVGAILRSACAFGAAGMIMQRKHAPELNGVLAKTACGAIEHVPVAYETNLSRTIEELQENGFFVYGLDERGEQEIGQIKPGGKTVLVLGAEGPGMRRLVTEKCDALVRLPMHGPMPSINVSNAAAVALYALKA